MIKKKYLKRSIGIWCWTMALLWVFKFIPFNLTDWVGNANKIPTEPYDLYAQYEANSLKRELDNRIVIIKIPDDANRDAIAKTLEDLKQCNPAVVGLDFLFIGEKDDESDFRLANAVNAFEDKIVVATLYDGNRLRHSYFADSIRPIEGCTNLDTNNKYDVIRTFIPEMEFEGEIMPSMAYVIGKLYTETRYIESFNVGDRTYIYWKSIEFPIIDATEIIEKKNEINGKIVLVGSVSSEIDVHRTSVSSDYSGVKVIAHSVRNIIDNDFIWHNKLFDIVVCGFILLICSFVIQCFECSRDRRYSDLTDIICLLVQFILLIVGVIYLGYKLYISGIYIDTTILLIGIVLMPIINDFYNAGKFIKDEFIRLYMYLKNKVLR